MKKLFTKLLLTTAIMLMGGANVWADTTVLYERGTTEENAWTAADVTVWGANDFSAATGLHKTGGNGSNSATLTINPAANSIIDVEAYWIGMSNTGRTFAQGNCSYFNYAGVWVEENDQDKASAYSINGFSNSNYTTFTSPSGRANRAYDPTAGAWYVIKMQINTATNTLVYLTVEGSDKLGTKLVDISNKTLTNPDYTKVIIGYLKSGSVGTTNNEYLKSIKISETTQSVTKADYTINYKFNGEIIKTVSGNTAVDETVNAESPITIEGQKYFAVDDAQTSMTIGADATKNVLNVELRKAYEYSYSVTTNFGGTIATGTYIEGEAAVNVNWGKYVQKDGAWYETEAPYGISISEETTKVVNYTASEIDYFIECEDMTKSRSAAANLAGFEYSGGLSPRHYSNSYWWTPSFAEGGVFTLVIPCRNNNSNATTISIFTRDSEGELTDTGLKIDCPAGSYTKTVENVVIPAGSSLVLNNTNAYNSNVYMDYLTLTKKTSIAISVPSTVGMATFCSPYNLDFTGKTIKAYAAAEVADGKVQLTQVDEVPAGEGVLLMAENGATEDIPVVESAGELVGNKFVGVLTETTVTMMPGNASYVFAYNPSEIEATKGFYIIGETSATVPAGKAYLRVPAGTNPPSVLAISLDGETAINTVEAAKPVAEQVAVYNISGQRVKDSYKGIVIKNGAKYLNK